MIDVLQKLEDRVINLVDELETLRAKLSVLVQENQAIRAENESLKGRSESEQEKLRGILNLLDGVEDDMAMAPAVAEAQFEKQLEAAAS